jgi:chromatin structure-remodeling complex subunit RSC1/2
MSTRRASAVEARQSIEAKASDEDVEMKDSIEEINSDADAEGEPNDEGDAGHDMFQTIHDLTTFLCSVEEEYALVLRLSNSLR